MKKGSWALITDKPRAASMEQEVLHKETEAVVKHRTIGEDEKWRDSLDFPETLCSRFCLSVSTKVKKGSGVRSPRTAGGRRARAGRHVDRLLILLRVGIRPSVRPEKKHE